MSNQLITDENYNTQTSLFPEFEEEKLEVQNEERQKEPNPRQLAPTFKPYDNRQIQMNYDIESLIPQHHEASAVDEKAREKNGRFSPLPYFLGLIGQPLFCRF